MKTASLLRVISAAFLVVNATDIPDVSDYTTDYVDSQARLQLRSNKSIEPRSVLGCHIYDIALPGFSSPPDGDCPALRATSHIIEAQALIATSEGSRHASRILKQAKRGWPSIRIDLQHIARYWNTTAHDLWHEVNGSSFFGLSASHRALVEGMALAQTFNYRCDGCAVAAPQILCFMDSFWAGYYMNANLNAEYERSGIDAGTLFSSIYTYDPEAGCTNSTFQPCSSRALANHKTVTDSFRLLYDINIGIPQGRAVAIGRYPEDKDSGGNPWYVTTLAAAEQLYLARLQWLDQGHLTVDDTSLPFFQDLLPWIYKGTYGSTHNRSGRFEFESILSAVQDYADGYMDIVRNYTPSDGSLSEQFSKYNGTPISTFDPLFSSTWSQDALSTAIDRRNGVKGPSWGEPLNNAVVTSQCYCHAHVTFRLRADPYTYAFVVGDVPELGNGNMKLARELQPEEPSMGPEYRDFSTQIAVPASTSITYHHFVFSIDEPQKRSDFSNRVITGECGSNTNVHDIFHAVFWEDENNLLTY